MSQVGVDGRAEPFVSTYETHSAIVTLFGDRAVKVKKPVNLGFLDFSTPERREAVCRREVELNRRLAPEVYLCVWNVVGPDGVACEHMVVMNRMPLDRRLSTLIAGGQPVARRCANSPACWRPSTAGPCGVRPSPPRGSGTRSRGAGPTRSSRPVPTGAACSTAGWPPTSNS
jgi:hypothetical protein